MRILVFVCLYLEAAKVFLFIFFFLKETERGEEANRRKQKTQTFSNEFQKNNEIKESSRS
jgi:hypothetical protein